MGQTVFVPREIDATETRVAASPETVKRLAGLGFDVVVEKDAGLSARITDADFTAVGATIGGKADAKRADVILKVRRPTEAELSGYKAGALVLAAMDPYGNDAAVAALARAGVSALAMEFMPRITRAQSMDILSSQANLAGYQAVIDAAAEYDRALPMMMTAAGTVPAAKVFVMGAGVAGLQAIATARRLGAVVTATDVRPAAKEQVASLGAKFIAVEDEEFKAAETAGGYAKEMSKEYQAKQAALTADHVSKQDIVITTALIPGRPAPKLISAAMVASMKPGSVIVDLAVERGGNVEGAKAGEVVTTANGVRIVGHLNVPGRVAASSSLLYAKNLYAFLETMVDKETKTLRLDPEEELVKATLLTHGGKVVHANFAGVAVDAAPARAAEADPKVAKTTRVSDQGPDVVPAKRRGRPPRNATAVDAAPVAGADPEVAKAAQGTEPGLDVAPKRRGRPPKAAAEAALPDAATAETPTKRRGRPPKNAATEPGKGGA